MVLRPRPATRGLITSYIYQLITYDCYSTGYFRNFKFHTITFTTLLFSDSFLFSQPFKLGLPTPPLIFISADADHRCFNRTIPNQVTWVPLHHH
ncbi:hypothetical protein HanRHA438_Chr13g0596641 [Helianthus annuus]|uniref:Uncharacterized protein n=1 Tax=Helianthus annuus TaxID=4232 RepID=A0A251SSR7_HELAN|nr:hypothetical protein HanXRQr2_Chr13g0585991 [Helianthus annuus]KAJ0858026.1 hypothetical protein HanRHA438_Chr13g0596641 [Helianthus annuus]